MNRRQAIGALCGLLAELRTVDQAGAQAGARAPVIGLLDAGRRLEWWDALRQQLRQLGYVEGRTVAFEERFADGDFDRLHPLAADLLRRKVAVIVTSGTVTARFAQEATRTIPIVMATGDDPVQGGLVTSLARPGGNVTGVTSLSAQVVRKRLDQLREALPRIRRLAVLWHRGNEASAAQLREVESAARQSKLTIQAIGVKDPGGLANAFAAMTRERAGAVYVISGPSFFAERQRIAELALKHRVPSMYTQAEFVEAGGLLSYGPSYAGLFQHAALYVDKILKGAAPGELPIEQPTTFELVVNLRTARALGITLPAQTLSRADRSIE